MAPPPVVKYTVFVSSTHDDLKDEREAVTDEILKLNHIPCGMEQFSAGTGRGWEVITQTIDICDYYILVIAGRYGSRFSDDDPTSWTEKEYEYARSKGLGIIAFVREDESITKANTDQDPEKVERLKAFIGRIDREHLREPWTTSDDLCRKVVSALAKQIIRDERDEAARRPGWYRGDNLPVDPNLARELARLSAENADLRTKLATTDAAPRRAKLELQTDDGRLANGTFEAVQPALLFKSNYVYLQPPGVNATVAATMAGHQRTIDERHAAMVADFSRLVWLSVRVFNSGAKAARAVRARFSVAPVDAQGAPGAFGKVALDESPADRRALLFERGGHVWVEGAEKDHEGTFRVVQRIESVGVERDEGLIRMGIFLPRNDAGEYVTHVVYEVDEEGGGRCNGEFSVRLRYDGEVAGTLDDLHSRLNSPGHTKITVLD